MAVKIKVVRLIRGVIILLACLPLAADVGVSYGAERIDLEAPLEQKVNIDWRRFAGTTINILCERSTINESVRRIKPRFEKLTGIKVNMVMLPEVELLDKTTIELATGSPEYDSVYLYMCSKTIKWAKAGWIAPLTPFINDPTLTDKEWLDLDDVVAKWMNAGKYKGDYYGIPTYGESDPIFYRTDLFEQYGVLAPQTFQELWDAAEALTRDIDGDGKIDVYGIVMRGVRGPISNVYIGTGFLRGFGGKFFAGEDPQQGMSPDAPLGKDNWMPVLSSPENVKGLQYYAGILRNFGPPGVSEYHHYEVLRDQLEGRAAMMIDASCFVSALENPAESKVVGKIGFAVGPHVPSIWCGGFGINAMSKHKEAVWYWLQWMTSKETLLRYSIMPEYPSMDVSRWSVINDPRYREKWDVPSPTGSFLEVAWEKIRASSADYLPRIPEAWEIRDALSIAVSRALTEGPQVAQEALNEAQQTAYEVMKEAGYF